MKTPNVMRKRMILGSTPVPVPYQGKRRRRSPSGSSGVGSHPKLVTGRLPGDEVSLLRELVRPGASISSPELTRQQRINGRISDVLGGISLLLVAGLWLSMIFGLVGMLLGTSMPFVGDGIIPITLYGVHIFGIPGAILNQRRHNFGVIAIACFWFTILASLPIGFIVVQLTRLIGG